MSLWTMLIMFGGYFFAISLLLVATLFFGWSRSLRALFVVLGLVSIIFQHGCNHMLVGLGRATSGSNITPNTFGKYYLLPMVLIVGWMILILIFPNWRVRKNKEN